MSVVEDVRKVAKVRDELTGVKLEALSVEMEAQYLTLHALIEI